MPINAWTDVDKVHKINRSVITFTANYKLGGTTTLMDDTSTCGNWICFDPTNGKIYTKTVVPVD